MTASGHNMAELLRQALAICFAEVDGLNIIQIARDDADAAYEVELSINDDKFYVCVYDEAIDGADTAAAIAMRLRDFNVANVIRDFPDFIVSVTSSGCIFGPV